MPRYYFNVQDGHTTLDEEGSLLPSLQEARDEALRLSGDILREGASATLWSGEAWRMWVTDAPNGAGKTLFTLRFSAADG